MELLSASGKGTHLEVAGKEVNELQKQYKNQKWYYVAGVKGKILFQRMVVHAIKLQMRGQERFEEQTHSIA